MGSTLWRKWANSSVIVTMFNNLETVDFGKRFAFGNIVEYVLRSWKPFLEIFYMQDLFIKRNLPEVLLSLEQNGQ